MFKVIKQCWNQGTVSINNDLAWTEHRTILSKLSMKLWVLKSWGSGTGGTNNQSGECEQTGAGGCWEMQSSFAVFEGRLDCWEVECVAADVTTNITRDFPNCVRPLWCVLLIKWSTMGVVLMARCKADLLLPVKNVDYCPNTACFISLIQQEFTNYM